MDPYLGTFLAQGVSAIFNGIAGQSEADAKNAAIQRQYAYDLQGFKFGKKRLKADYRHSVKQWKLNKSNEESVRLYNDETDLQDWEFKLKIQDAEYASQLKQYAKSEQIYNQQLTFNQMAQAAANEAEYRKLEDAMKELAFQNQDIFVKALESQDLTAVKGQQGRSAQKGEQVELAALGRNQAILAESLLSAKADTSAALRKIANDKFGADIAAEQNRMLLPDRLPAHPKPIKRPVHDYLKPRKPRRYDFGPRPVKGAMASSAGAWIQAGGQLASAAAGGVNKVW